MALIDNNAGSRGAPRRAGRGGWVPTVALQRGAAARAPPATSVYRAPSSHTVNFVHNYMLNEVNGGGAIVMWQIIWRPTPPYMAIYNSRNLCVCFAVFGGDYT